VFQKYSVDVKIRALGILPYGLDTMWSERLALNTPQFGRLAGLAAPGEELDTPLIVTASSFNHDFSYTSISSCIIV
jgi:hypothetical protein